MLSAESHSKKVSHHGFGSRPKFAGSTSVVCKNEKTEVTLLITTLGIADKWEGFLHTRSSVGILMTQKFQISCFMMVYL